MQVNLSKIQLEKHDYFTCFLFTWMCLILNCPYCYIIECLIMHWLIVTKTHESYITYKKLHHIWYTKAVMTSCEGEMT